MSSHKQLAQTLTSRYDKIMRKLLSSHRLTITFIILFFLTLNIGIIITPIEQSLNPNTSFRTIEDGIWWGFTTVTAVGYGDLTPGSTLGRMLGIILMTVGVISFGLVATFLTVNLLRQEQQFYWRRETERFDRLEKKIDQLEKQQLYSLKNDFKPQKKAA